MVLLSPVEDRGDVLGYLVILPQGGAGRVGFVEELDDDIRGAIYDLVYVHIYTICGIDLNIFGLSPFFPIVDQLRLFSLVASPVNDSAILGALVRFVPVVDLTIYPMPLILPLYPRSVVKD